MTTWQRALVTGASAGIGEQFAHLLAAGGTDLVLLARRESKLAALAAELGQRHDVDVEVVAADLTDPADLDRVERRLAEADRPIDLLVNNAGFGTRARFETIPEDRLRREIALNVTAVVHLTHTALQPMVAAGRGGIVNVASMVGFLPTPYMAVYGATKAFVVSFTEALHEELRGTGVHVTALCPGATRTEFAEVADVHEDYPSAIWMPADRVARIGLDAVDANRAVAVPGLLNRLGGVAIRSSPTVLARKVYGRIIGRELTS